MHKKIRHYYNEAHPDEIKPAINTFLPLILSLGNNNDASYYYQNADKKGLKIRPLAMIFFASENSMQYFHFSCNFPCEGGA